MRTAKTHVVIGVVIGVALTVATVALAPLMHRPRACESILTRSTQSFGSSKLGWGTWQHDSRVSLTGQDVRSPPKALLVTAGSGASAMWHVPSSRFSTTGVYFFQGYAKLATGSGGLNVSAQSFSSNWGFLGQTTFASQDAGADGWTPISGSFAVPALSTNVLITFDGQTATWRLDDVSLVLTGSGASPCDPPD